MKEIIRADVLDITGVVEKVSIYHSTIVEIKIFKE